MCFAAMSAIAVTAAPQESTPRARLFDLTTAHGIENEQPLQPASSFPPEEDAIYLWYEAEGCAIGTTIRSVWFYMETDPPTRLASAAVVVEQDGTWGQFTFRLAPGKRWAVGRYRVELWLGDELAATTEFAITVVWETGARSYPTPPSATISRRRIFVDIPATLLQRQVCVSSSAVLESRLARRHVVCA